MERDSEFSYLTHQLVDLDASKVVLSAEEFEAFLGKAVSNGSGQRVLPPKSGWHEGCVPFMAFEQAINGTTQWKVKLRRS